jgi:ATP-dependent Clp protease ATP-binding subunit ClpA
MTAWIFGTRSPIEASLPAPGQPAPLPTPSFLPPIHPEVQSLLNKREIEDLTEEVKKDPPPPCYGRDNDVKWIALRVASPQKNSVLVTGSAGVGKTRLYYHIAQLVSINKAPPGLRGKRIFLLLSEPKKVLEVLAKYYSQQCILVSDEVHSILKKEGWFGSQQDQSAELKPYIGSGKTPFIGFTDRPDSFLNDNAWVRRFHPRNLEEMSIPDAVKAVQATRIYLQNKFKKMIEDTYQIYSLSFMITSEAIELAVKLSVIYLPKEFLPDKPSKILEPACIAKMTESLEGKDNLYQTLIEVTAEDILLHVQQEYRVTSEEVEEALSALENTLLYSPIPLTEPLMKYTQNENDRARRKLVLPAYGREDELQKVTTILSAVESNNVILKGYAGCGKSRIGEGLAVKIIQGDVPSSLKNVQVLSLDLNSLLGDTKYRGEFESKFKEFLRSAEKYTEHFILVIDEIHRIVGAGRTEHGNDDVANQFKNLMARGKLRVLGMTTPQEYSYIENDPAFLRRFQTLEIEPFSVPQTIEVIKADKPHLQEKYSRRTKSNYNIDDSACEAAAYLAVQYLPKEYLPASAYKIFHCACAFAQTSASAGQLTVSVNENTIVKYINYFFKKEKNEKTLRQVENDLVRLRAELHPNNQLIPLHEPIIQFSENWINKARRGLFKSTVHRNSDIQRILEILGCKTVNNALLVGRAGSGKTSLAQQIAILMTQGQILQNRLFLSLKLQDLLDQARKSPNTITNFIESLQRCAGNFILFIDEFHTFFQVKTKDGLFLYDLFKPILAEGKVRLIGATTPEEATAYILNKGEAVTRRFAPHYLPELTEAQSVDALAGSQKDYESHYSDEIKRKVEIDPSTFLSAVQEAQKRLGDQALPGKAISLFEEACSAKTMQDDSIEVKITPADILRFAEERYPLPKPAISWMTRLYSFVATWLKFFFRSPSAKVNSP